MKNAMIGIAAALAASAVCRADGIEDRFVFAQTSLGSDSQTSNMVDLVRRAGALGFNGLVLQGGLDYAWRASGREKRNLAAIKAACDAEGVELVPAVWSAGYGTMLAANPNLAAGIPVEDVPYRVSADGRRAAFECPSGGEVLVPNGDFEEFAPGRDGAFKVAGWDVDVPGKVAHMDAEVKWSGRQSLRYELAEAAKTPHNHARAHCRIKLKPRTRYMMRAKIKTEGLDTTGGFQATLYTKPGKGEVEGSTRQLTMNRPKIQKTCDWTDMTMEISTLDWEEFDLYLGSWYAKEGRFWLDAVTIEETGFDRILRRPGCPLSVRDAATGTVYEEGRDFAGVPPLKKGQEAMPLENGSLVLEILPGGRISPGSKLLVSGYSRHRMKSDSQVSTCMSEPEFYELIEKSAAGIQEAIAPRKWFFAMDEVRAGGTCAACRARNTDMAHIFGGCVARMRDIVARVSPGATVYMWGDQLDPLMNAKKSVMLCRGSFEGVADLVPKDIVVMHWGGHVPEAFSFFGGKGFTLARSRCIDGDWGKVSKTVAEDWEAASAEPRCRGFMYTTWRRDYSQEKLEAFSRLWGGKRQDRIMVK